MLPLAAFESRFEALRKAGTGGAGTVFRARDRVAGGDVAIKILRGHDAHDVERFAREATILAELEHPGIVRYVAHGVRASGEHYLAMEWLEGEDLERRLARRGLSVAEGLTLVRRAAEALAFAHAQGLIHRDLKPQNLVLLGGDVERVKLVDFGIARLGGEGRRLTHTGALLGTPGYIAPELIQGPGAHDARVDVFSLGCVLFECLAGRPAFEGMNAMAVLAKILLQPVPRVRAYRPGLPEALDDLVARMMARDPDERPHDAAAVIEELGRLGPGEGGSALRQPGSGGGHPHTPGPGGGHLGEGPAPSSLGRDEQRLVSVVLAGDPEGEDRVATPDPAAVREVVATLGGRVDALGGAALVVTLWGAQGATDRAERAARCALAISARFPSLPVCVATGRGLASARTVDGDVIERGVRALSMLGPPSRGSAVRLDEATAGMLGPGFLVEREGGAVLLRGEAAAGGPTLPFVGRARELAMIEGVLSGCVSESAASAVILAGGEGMGKTRLRLEVVEALARRGERPEVLVIAGRAGQEDGALLGRIRAACAEGPAILVLEDMHRADGATVRRVDEALRELRDRPLLVIALARPEALARFPDAWAGRGVQMIRVGPLSRKAAAELARAALGADAAATVVEDIVDRAAGNPLCVEQLARASGRAGALPDAILALIEAQLDAEGSRARRVLRAASVFGPRFTRAGVEALLGGDGEVVEALAALSDHELIVPEGDGYAFARPLVREAAYAMLPEVDRALGHRLAAAWLADQPSPDAVAVADHFRRGGDPESAAEWSRRSAPDTLGPA